MKNHGIIREHTFLSEASMVKNTVFAEIMKLHPLEQQELYEELYNIIHRSSNSIIAYMDDIREARFASKPHCPHCNSKNIKGHGKYRGRQRYKCKDCSKTFNDTTASPMAGTHHPDKWAEYIQCMVEGKTLKESADQLDIHISTAFYWRHKVLNALNAMEDDSLRGIVESDEKFFLESNKGKNQVSKDSKRNPRKRGGTASKRGISDEQVCIVVAMDRAGHIVNKTACKGRITAKIYDEAIGNQFSDDAILCTDSAFHYKTFTNNNGLEHKPLNGSKKQHVIDKVYHIQHVNSYHSRLEDWINRKFRGVATKYMDNYLAWIRFLEISRDMDKNTRKKTLLTTMFKVDMVTTVKLLKPA